MLSVKHLDRVRRIYAFCAGNYGRRLRHLLQLPRNGNTWRDVHSTRIAMACGLSEIRGGRICTIRCQCDMPDLRRNRFSVTEKSHREVLFAADFRPTRNRPCDQRFSDAWDEPFANGSETLWISCSGRLKSACWVILCAFRHGEVFCLFASTAMRYVFHQAAIHRTIARRSADSIDVLSAGYEYAEASAAAEENRVCLVDRYCGARKISGHRRNKIARCGVTTA